MKNILMYLVLFLPLFVFGQSAEELYELATQLYAEEAFEEAVDHLDRAILQDPGKEECYLLKVKSLISLDERSRALVACTLALKKFPKSWELHI